MNRKAPNGTGTQHGWLPCRACFPSGVDTLEVGDWRLVRNPGYWGSPNPETLVLGFSKGANQVAESWKGDFDRIAFARMRARLIRVLQVLGVAPGLSLADEDAPFLPSAPGIGFASLVRCSLSMFEEKTGKWTTSGTIMRQAVGSACASTVMSRCATTFLGTLPPSVRVVVLLGTTKGYMKGVRSVLAQVHLDFKTINEVSFSAGGAVWVFAVHPSGANGTFERWCSGDAATVPGGNREAARRAIDAAGR